MPVPLPEPDRVRLDAPRPEEIRAVCGAFTSALAGPDGLTDLQRIVLTAVTKSMTGFDIDLDCLDDVGPDDLGRALADRNEIWRQRIVQVMLIGELLLRPIPPEIAERVERYAEALGVDDDMFPVARRLSKGALGLALVDFRRSGYEGNWDYDHVADALHLSKAIDDPWGEAPDDPALAVKWAALEQCPPGSLGGGVFQFYDARGFAWPGSPGSAPPLLAQHDWIHVLADYGSTVESEIEVFSLISRANDDPRAFSLQAMVLSLFETGYLATGANLFEYDTGHLSGTAEQMAVRMGDAMRRGALCTCGDDLLAVDWFAFASEPVDDVRRELGIVPKSEAAWRAGSVTAWERGGISPYQFEHGQRRSAESGRAYRSYGASPVVP